MQCGMADTRAPEDGVSPSYWAGLRPARLDRIQMAACGASLKGSRINLIRVYP